MSSVMVVPEFVSQAAGQLGTIGLALNAAHAAAAGPTTSVVAAGQDEVSAAISALFGNYGREYQALTARTALFHDHFVQTLTSGGNAYNGTEAASINSLGGLDLVVQQRLLSPLRAEWQAFITVAEDTLNRLRAGPPAPTPTPPSFLPSVFGIEPPPTGVPNPPPTV
jgi:hypothetical protein